MATRVTVRRGQFRTVDEIIVIEVPEPLLARLEALDDSMSGRFIVVPAVL